MDPCGVCDEGVRGARQLLFVLCCVGRGHGGHRYSKDYGRKDGWRADNGTQHIVVVTRPPP